MFTSRDLVSREFSSVSTRNWSLPLAFMARHGISTARLEELLLKFEKLSVLVVGDLIVDEYISCDPLGMSQEDPTLVVRPVDSKRFIGGAGIVAAHASGLSGKSMLLSVVGSDAEAVFARNSLEQLGVRAELFDDPTRPTTLKTRFRCQGKTLLRVSRLNQTAVVPEISEQILNEVQHQKDKVDLVIFSDFNYGVLPQEAVEDLSGILKSTKATMCADSQSSSQFGDVARFEGMDLLTPTEREARLSVRNTGDGLNVLGESLRSLANARHVILKLGQQGALVCPSGENNKIWPPDQIEALNADPKDVAGAGDSLLTVSGMALAVGATIWEAACLGSIAAAVQVGRLGNTAISMEEMLSSLKR
ncbi:MAG: bifunctional ADP-heptose synthase [Luminiphilus sp.]